jgi:DICT domain-containing protein
MGNDGRIAPNILGPMPGPDPAAVTIGTLSEATGVSISVLRSWEQRYGFPRASRSAGGHRRYPSTTIGEIDEVLRYRAAGMSLGAAISSVDAQDRIRAHSFASGLRSRWSHLQPQPLSKRAMLAFSRMIEDECCARADLPTLVGAFQEERFYRASEERWRSLCSTARAAIVLADFADERADRSAPIEVPLDEHAPALREWVVICDSPDRSACLVGWERPITPQGERTFEAFWTVDPIVVRAATEIGIALAIKRDPLLAELRMTLHPPAADASASRQLAELIAMRVAGALAPPVTR